MECDDLARIVTERAVEGQLVRLARAMDERSWDVVAGVFLPDATAELGTGELSGSEQIVASMRSYLDACGPTQHLLGNVLVEVDGDRAESRAHVSDLHLGTGDRSTLTFSTLGDYHDRWELHGSAWGIRHRTKLSHAVVGTFEVFSVGGAASPEGPGAEVD